MSSPLSERVRVAIAKSSATHRDFAQSVGLDPTKLSKSLNGVRRFTADELTVIADTAKVSLQWLLDGKGPGPAANGGVVTGDDASGLAGLAALRYDDRRIRILEAATELIAENGYHAVRISDIAEACGTSSGTVHYYFPGKDDVLTSALRYCVEQTLNRLNPDLRIQQDAYQRLTTLVELQLPKTGKLRREWAVWLQFWTESALRPELREIYNQCYAQWLDIVVRIVRRGQQEGTFRDIDAEAFGLRFAALIDGLAVQVLTEMPGVGIDRMRSELLAVIERELITTR